MHQGCQLLVWLSIMPRGFVWKGTLGKMTILYPTQLSLTSMLFKAFYTKNFPKGHMDFQWIWFVGMCKGGDTWTGELSTILNDESEQGEGIKIERLPRSFIFNQWLG